MIPAGLPLSSEQVASLRGRWGATDVSAGHVALHHRVTTRQPHVSSPLFCCRFWFHFYCALIFIFIFMGPWMKPELLCF